MPSSSICGAARSYPGGNTSTYPARWKRLDTASGLISRQNRTAGAASEFSLDTIDDVVPGAPPPGFPARERPTTQILIRRAGWPGNVFRLWLPESVGQIWSNRTSAAVRQSFARTERHGLLWTFEQQQTATIAAELIPLDGSLRLVVRVTNDSGSSMSDIDAMNCFQFSDAPDFDCDDFSRIYIRSQGQWESLAALRPTCGDPYYYRAGHFQAGGASWMGGKLAYANQSAPADHPLMVCVSKDGRRSVGTASERFLFLFHNQGNEHLRCIHSQQEPVAVLGPGETAAFQQEVFFVAGGLAECVEAFEGRPAGESGRRIIAEAR